MQNRFYIRWFEIFVDLFFVPIMELLFNPWNINQCRIILPRSSLTVNLKFSLQISVNGFGYTIEGNRSALKVIFHLDKHIFIKLPPRLQAGGGVKVVPVMFNHGMER